MTHIIAQKSLIMLRHNNRVTEHVNLNFTNQTVPRISHGKDPPFFWSGGIPMFRVFQMGSTLLLFLIRKQRMYFN